MEQPDDDRITRVIGEVDGTLIVVLEKPDVIARREVMLRRCAILVRVQLESYERKLPPLELRSHRTNHAHQEYQQRVLASVIGIVTRLDTIAPGGCIRDWHRIVDEVGHLDFDAVMRELFAS